MNNVQTKTTPRNDQRRRRTGSLLLSSIDDEIGDLIAVASIREQARLFGLDRVRGL